MQKLSFTIIISICFIGLILRLFTLPNSPPGFFCDEASIGYNAYSLLKTGKDEYGKQFPLFFQAFGEYKNPLDIYSTIPFVWLFGLREESVRFVSITYCLAASVLLFFIGKNQKKPILGLLSASFFVFSPWALHLSKTNMEGLFILVFLITLILLVQSTQMSLKKQWILTSIISAVATYSYFPARIIMPLYVGLFAFFIIIKTKSWKMLFVGLFLFTITCLPIGIHMLDSGMNRWNLVSVFSSPSQSPVRKIIYSYVHHFSPDFLFFKGDAGMKGQFITRHSVKGIGEFYPWQIVFLCIGILYCIRTKNTSLSFSLLAITLLYPIPSSLTQDSTPQATRAIAGLAPLCLLSGFGGWEIFRWLRQKMLWQRIYVFLIILLLSASTAYYLHLERAYLTYASDYWGWQYGPKEIIAYFLSQKDSYDELYMTGIFNEPNMFYKFYDPTHQCVNCFVGGIHNFNPAKRQLFAFRMGEIPNELQGFTFYKKKNIYLPGGTIEYIIGEITPDGVK